MQKDETFNVPSCDITDCVNNHPKYGCLLDKLPVERFALVLEKEVSVCLAKKQANEYRTTILLIGE